MVTIALGLVNWLVTLLLVESEVVRPFREWIANRYNAAHTSNREVPSVRSDGWRVVLWYKAKYFVGCHLCTGTWVGVILAILTSWNKPLGSGVIGIVLTGLLYKAIGHVVLILQKLGERWAR